MAFSTYDQSKAFFYLIYEEIQKKSLLYKGTSSERVFSSFLCHKVYVKTRVQLKTSYLAHFFLKVEIFQENDIKVLLFKPQPFFPETIYFKFQKRN